MLRQKRVAAIHDVSCFGKCSLTVALPILSVAGIETCIIPTAVLSTHTGGFEGYTYRDLTADILPIARHWKSLNLAFDALYSGYLGSFEQLNIMEQFFDMYKTEDNVILIDPVMADHGRLYDNFTVEFVAGMKKLCSRANIIVPNMTEACFMVGETYHKGPYTEEFIKNILKKLAQIGPKQIVLTGVWFDEDRYGSACYDKNIDKIYYAFSKKIEGTYLGTGDIYASALLAAILSDFTLEEAAQIAVDFTAESIRVTGINRQDQRFGVDFERCLPKFIERLGQR